MRWREDQVDTQSAVSLAAHMQVSMHIGQGIGG